MKRILACLWISTASAAIAEPITVQSGNHEGFTRLVMRLPPAVTWQVESSIGRQSITFAGHSAGFDLSQTFKVIPRDFLSDVLQSPSRIDLELSCACEVKTFVEQNEFLVVDILDGPALPERIPTQKPRTKQTAPRSSFNYGDLLWSSPISSKQAERRTQQNTEIERPDDLDPILPQSERQLALVDATRNRLLEGVSDAASRGILQAATPALDGLTMEEDAGYSAEVFDSSDQVVDGTPPNTGNLRISNSRDVPNTDTLVDLTTSGAVCANPQSLAVPEWGNDRPYNEQISIRRVVIYDELGRLDHDRAIELARQYLFFGFGIEAKQVLRLSEKLEMNNPELMDLADIMEFGHARNPRFVHRYLDCDSDLALWALMAAKTIPKDQVVNDEAALRALTKLPLHLREFLAPIVSKRLLENGNLEAASIALRALELGNDQPTAKTGLAKAKIESVRGNTETADALLDDVVQSNTQESPKALIELIDRSLVENTAVTADIALLIESFAFELRESELGTELVRAHIIASAKSNQFSKAFDAMKYPDVLEDAELLAELQSHVFLDLARSAEDITFLENVFTNFPDQPEDIKQETIRKTSERLRKLGFSERAEIVLNTIPLEEQDTHSRILLSQIRLDLGKPSEALEAIQNVAEDTANQIRAEAYLALGDNRAASTLFQAANVPNSAARSAWLSDDWVELTPTHAPELRDITSLASEAVVEIPTEAGMLSVTEAALEQSASARSVLENLLEELSVSP